MVTMEEYRKIKTFCDGSVLVEHRDEKGFLLARYIGYFNYRNDTVKLYPARGERHFRCRVHTISVFLLK